MAKLHPGLPRHRPLAIAHRAGNSIAEAKRAIAIAADMIETDIWLRGTHLDIRHMHRLGPLPILWERWRLGIDWKCLQLHELLEAMDDDALLFLDLKGNEPDLGEAIVSEIRRHAPKRHVAVCGRTYEQLDRIIDEPEVTVFYSVGEAKEWSAAWPRLERMAWPALSVHRKLVNPEVMARLTAMNATVVSWNVNTPAHAQFLWELGVDGFTSDNASLLHAIATDGEAGLYGGEGATRDDDTRHITADSATADPASP